MKSNRAGKIAEFIARCYMRGKGYRVIARNEVTGRGTHAGEIDFIAAKGSNLIFVEVKKRSSAENAAFAIKPTQQHRIRRGAEAFLQRNPQYNHYNIRFDAILIVPPFYLTHIVNAWQ